MKVGLLPTSAIDGVYGIQTERAVEKVKYRLGYPHINKGNEVAGLQLHNYLSGATHLPLHYVALRKIRIGSADHSTPSKQETKEAALRQAIVQHARWGALHESQIHYTMSTGRDDWLSLPVGVLPLNTDCSGFATYCYKWAGASDPNGQKYKVLGYTGTLLSHMRHITAAAADVGDLIVYGSGTGHHVVIIISVLGNNDFLTVSHGQERGPIELRHSVEQQFQPRPANFLTIF